MPEEVFEKEELKDGLNEIQLVIFKLGGEEYGVEIHEVERIIKFTDITRIPHTPDFVEGIINLRGKIVVIVNLLKRFGTFNENEHIGSHIIISQVEGNSFGIIVDDVEEVLKISKDDTRKAPGIISSKIHVEYLRGIGILEGGKRLIILLDLPKILAEKEMLEMAEMTHEIKKQAEIKERAEKKLEESKKPKITEKEIEQRFKEHFSDLEKAQKNNNEESIKETNKEINNKNNINNANKTQHYEALLKQELEKKFEKRKLCRKFV